MAALNEALREAIDGLTTEQAEEVRLAFGEVMGYLVEQLINPAIRAFPELDPDPNTWVSVAKARAMARSHVV